MVHLLLNSPDMCNWNENFQLQSKEDVATLLATYEKCLQNYRPEDIYGMVERNGFYACIVNVGEENDFDLFTWLNTKYAFMGRTEINCLNARFLFPAELSKGEYVEETVEPKPSNTGDFEDSSDETDTGFWDEEDIIKDHYVRHVASGESILIEDEDGVIFGRSQSRSGYSVDNDLMSRLHARVYMDEDGKYMVEDLGSRNGTYVNNMKVFPGKDREIRPGNTLRMANEEFKLV